MATLSLEDGGLPLWRCFHHAALRGTAVCTQPTLIREQDLPYPRAYFTVGNIRAAVIPKTSEISARWLDRAIISSSSASASGACYSVAWIKR